MEKTVDIFKRKRMTGLMAAIIVLAIYAGASVIVEFNTLSAMGSMPAAIIWMAGNLIPNAEAMQKLPNILDKLIETALLSVAVTVIAGVFAFFFSLLGANITKVNPLMKRFVRIVAAFFRNVPDVVWAMLLMFSFGQNILTGFFALFCTTFGLLTRAFIETIDEVSSACVEALEATGAGFIQMVFQGIVPSSICGITTWILYMIETNIRSSTLIGLLTATGIGYLFDLYYKRLDFASASLVVYLIVILVIGIEMASNRIRKVIM